ncbi:SixA phosphatase family protein [Pontibacter cellulosilyticus]|uniref:Histidine phosphatase family protein n=1 Tax=Pontibacter cellulosilyticus TaxID=1720253 RepID=A0A923SIN6_9BACT|nr:histidine phosphatase family protein [Pontibacter cellulosilyticus]MBC5991856.1 histidine phosphatase family protein [Pontibacter cellulosilyticus]
MQRKILICRHAETEEPYPLQPDFERELTLHGSQQARDTGAWLREKFGKVDKIVASPAKRVSHTARIIASRLYFDLEKISYVPDLYNAKEHELLKCLSELPEDVKSILLIGHNPGITKLVREITHKMIGYLEPAEVASIDISLETWDQLYFSKGNLIGTTNQEV